MRKRWREDRREGNRMRKDGKGRNQREEKVWIREEDRVKRR